MSVRYEKGDGIAYVTFDRPAVRNALDPEAIVRLADAWRDVRDDPAVRVAILTGAGTEAFSSGADLARLIPLFTRARRPEDDWDRRLAADPTLLQTALLRNSDLYKPVVAAVNRFCVAGGRRSSSPGSESTLRQRGCAEKETRRCHPPRYPGSNSSTARSRMR